jgi:hypothetical protein
MFVNNGQFRELLRLVYDARKGLSYKRLSQRTLAC